MRCKNCGTPIRECHIQKGKECYEPIYFRVLCEMVASGKDVDPKHTCYLATVNETKKRMK